MHTIMKAAVAMATTSGLNLIPRDSSSKKRSKPALDAGMGASRRLLRLLKPNTEKNGPQKKYKTTPNQKQQIYNPHPKNQI